MSKSEGWDARLSVSDLDVRAIAFCDIRLNSESFTDVALKII